MLGETLTLNALKFLARTAHVLAEYFLVNNNILARWIQYNFEELASGRKAGGAQSENMPSSASLEDSWNRVSAENIIEVENSLFPKI